MDYFLFVILKRKSIIPRPHSEDIVDIVASHTIGTRKRILPSIRHYSVVEILTHPFPEPSKYGILWSSCCIAPYNINVGLVVFITTTLLSKFHGMGENILHKRD